MAATLFLSDGRSWQLRDADSMHALHLRAKVHGE